MTIKEKYGLEFHSKILHESNHYNISFNKGYYFLQFIGYCDILELKGLLDDINESLESKNSFEGEHLTNSTTLNIICDYPNIKISDWTSKDITLFIISMVDLKGLIEEWLEFVKSEEIKRKGEKSIIAQVRKKIQIFIKSILNKNEPLS